MNLGLRRGKWLVSRYVQAARQAEYEAEPKSGLETATPHGMAWLAEQRGESRRWGLRVLAPGSRFVSASAALSLIDLPTPRHAFCQAKWGEGGISRGHGCLFWWGRVSSCIQNESLGKPQPNIDSTSLNPKNEYMLQPQVTLPRYCSNGQGNGHRQAN